MQTLLAAASRIAPLLVRSGASIAVAESSAGGLVSAALLAVPGASAYFRGGDVIYTRDARTAFGITPEMMAGMRSASEPYARVLAAHARVRLGTLWGLAETGASGPSGNSYGDAAGHSCLAVNGPVQLSRVLATGSSDRVANMLTFAEAALVLLEEAIAAAALHG